MVLSVKYVKNNKDNDNDWFRLESNKEGTKLLTTRMFPHFSGGLESVGRLSTSLNTNSMFNSTYVGMLNISDCQIPIGYPATNPEIAIPELDGKTAKMYRCPFFILFL